MSSLANQVVLGSFSLAVIFGFAASRSNFCTMGAVSDIVNMQDWSRMRMWLLAIAVAMVGTQAANYLGWIDISKAFYLRNELTWASHILGGLLFGFGMVLASGCGSKTLVRIGGGNLKSLVVFIVMGVVAYMSLKGIFAVARTASIDKLAVSLSGGQGLTTLLGASAANVKLIGLALAAAFALLIAIFAFKSEDFRSNKTGWFAAIIIGLVIAGTWVVSGKFGFGENQETLETMYFATNSRTIESFSFVAPAAYSLELLMLWSDSSLKITLGIAATIGVVVGAFIDALIAKSFRWEGFGGVEDTANHIVGAVLMGFGGVLALGCTIGQGLTGLSTLALGSFISFAAIIGGGWLGLKYQMWRIERM
jgi:uncharacterized protein